jgi:predicted transcriptional regulator
MERETLELLIEKGLSQRELANELKTSQGNIKYWLKKLELATIKKLYNKKDDVEKYCPKCETIKPLGDFYKRYNREDYGGYCKNCSNQYHTERVKNVKLKMIDYKGGECLDCELKLEDTHYAVFDFHHLDPTTKDENFERIKYQSWEKIKEELDKCVLLCSNCHRVRHAGIEGW